MDKGVVPSLACELTCTNNYQKKDYRVLHVFVEGELGFQNTTNLWSYIGPRTIEFLTV
jgi:hypothetical protein